MTSNARRLLLNLVLLAMLAGLVWFVATREPQKTESSIRLYDEAMGDDITRVLIHLKGRDDILIENLPDKMDGKRSWVISKPVRAKADKDKVRLLFTLLTDPAAASYEASGRDLKQYGLDQETMSISFNGVKLLLGKFNPVTQTRYVLKGDKIYLIAETVTPLIQAGLDEFKQAPAQKPEKKTADQK